MYEMIKLCACVCVECNRVRVSWNNIVAFTTFVIRVNIASLSLIDDRSIISVISRLVMMQFVVVFSVSCIVRSLKFAASRSSSQFVMKCTWLCIWPKQLPLLTHTHTHTNAHSLIFLSIMTESKIYLYNAYKCTCWRRDRQFRTRVRLDWVPVVPIVKRMLPWWLFVVVVCYDTICGWLVDGFCCVSVWHRDQKQFSHEVSALYF